MPRMERPRSKFDRSHQLLTTINEGDLVPIYCDEVLPGDTARIRLNGLIRMSTPIYPVMDNAYMDTYFFFVPCRLLWEHWENMFGENDTNYWAEKTEYSTPTCTIGGISGLNNGSIGDYFGLPTNIEKGIKVNALPARAYAMIYNEWFRDENLEAPMMLGYKKTDEGGTNANAKNETWSANRPDSTTNNNEGILYAYKPAKAGKFHDYFTSCLPSPLKSDPVEISLTGNAPVGLYKNDKLEEFGTVNGNQQIYFNQSVTVGSVPGISNSLAGNRNSLVSGSSDKTQNAPDSAYLAANMSAVSGVTIADLRMAIALQHIFEADARNGTRYREFLSGTWGVTSPDSRLQIPEYIGGQRIPINVNQVVQTSQTDEKTGQALGNTAAYSLTTCSKEMVDYAATEYGYIIGLAVVRVEHSYQQGLATKWTRGGRFTYYDPRLAALGEQPVYNREIYAQGTAEDNEIFGYQEAWADYRYKPSYVTGEMRSNYQTSLDAWHYADDYNALPRLSAEWIQEGTQNIDRTIAVTSAKSHQFLCDFYFNEEWFREMPIYSIPGIERI
ncbi:putative VP1 [Human gut gokushovirus]|nr:putative VP1 [Human gut gokushovirus]